MSNDYGLVVNNNDGGVMFDSRKGMSSYVIREMGTGTGVSDSSNIEDEFIFIRPPSGQENALSSKIIFASPRYNGANVNFFQYDEDDDSAIAVELDYFVVTHSDNISTSSDDYGLQIKNSDNSIQFDSRSVKLGSHFLITAYHPPRTVNGDISDSSSVSLGDYNDYWEIGKWTFSLGHNFSHVPTSLQGIQFFPPLLGEAGEVKAHGWNESDSGDGLSNNGGLDDEPNGGGGIGGNPFGPGPNTGGNSGRTFHNIRQIIVSAELV